MHNRIGAVECGGEGGLGVVACKIDLDPGDVPIRLGVRPTPGHPDELMIITHPTQQRRADVAGGSGDHDPHVALLPGSTVRISGVSAAARRVSEPLESVHRPESDGRTPRALPYEDFGRHENRLFPVL
jgi:hypothetical protein